MKAWKLPSGGLVKAFTDGVEFEAPALAQVENAAQMPFIYPHIAVMPDVHMGFGATVGSVIPTSGAVIPAAVGVDIGCGMMAIRLSLTASDLPDSLVGLRSEIERVVPHGRTNNGADGDRGAWHDVPKRNEEIAQQLVLDYCTILGKHPKIATKNAALLKHLGTLGTGNHFVEVCLDEEQRVWVMLHSGSRGVGNKIGTYFIELAKEDMRRYFINLPDVDLAYLPEGTQHYKDYVEAVSWAQRYAMMNRELMMSSVLAVLEDTFPGKVLRGDNDRAVNCHHNYVEMENHAGRNVLVTRKGAVRARKGDLGIIPGSMGAKSYIVRGKGNPDSLNSCSHGAGRRMSRTKARAHFSIEDHAKATAGVECRKDADVIDETPGAYKDIDAVMEAQKDLVDVVHALKQVLCVKG